MKIFFFDVDDTTFDHSITQVRPSTLYSLRKLKEKGYLLGVITSRAQEEMFNIPKEMMDLLDVKIYEAGTHIVYPDHEEKILLNREENKKACEYLTSKGIDFHYITESGKGYLAIHSPREKMFLIHYGFIPSVKPYEGENLIHNIYFSHEKEVVETVASLMPDADFYDIGRCIEVMPKGINKKDKMLETAKKLNIEPSEICAFGDGNNDGEMLKAAGLGICMGNGTDSCKKMADYVTDDISDEGLYKALVHFGFIEEYEKKRS